MQSTYNGQIFFNDDGDFGTQHLHSSTFHYYHCGRFLTLHKGVFDIKSSVF